MCVCVDLLYIGGQVRYVADPWPTEHETNSSFFLSSSSSPFPLLLSSPNTKSHPSHLSLHDTFSRFYLSFLTTLHIYVHRHMCTYVYTQVHLHTWTHTHTHTHTHTEAVLWRLNLIIITREPCLSYQNCCIALITAIIHNTSHIFCLVDSIWEAAAAPLLSHWLLLFCLATGY